ncbi:MAG TPA: hypothetical protein VJG83_04175 [archaeon]|nr:hypothetical protein [archaeon]
MAFIEILQAGLSLDFKFFVDLLVNNIFWVFAFYAAGYYFSNGKSPLANSIIYASMVLVSIDMFNVVGFSIYTALGLGILYMIRVPLLLFLEKTKGGAQYLSLAWLLTWYLTIAIVAFMV